MDFGRMMKTLRLSAGLGLRELSRIIDVSPTYLSLVENGKQAPPTAMRITQIEQALRVPVGCLNSLVHGLGTDAATYVEQVPESADFLEVAKRNYMTSADFLELTGFLNHYGWQTMRQTLADVRLTDVEPGSVDQEYANSGPYVWPFLCEKYIFDINGSTDKISFLETAVSRIAEQGNGFDKEAVLNRILEREGIASTGIGGGIAVPHAYLPELKNMTVALMRMPDGLDFDSIDRLPVHLAILLVGPPSGENLHLMLLARIAKLLSYNSLRTGLLQASGPGEIFSIFKAAELGIP